MGGSFLCLHFFAVPRAGESRNPVRRLTDVCAYTRHDRSSFDVYGQTDFFACEVGSICGGVANKVAARFPRRFTSECGIGSMSFEEPYPDIPSFFPGRWIGLAAGLQVRAPHSSWIALWPNYSSPRPDPRLDALDGIRRQVGFRVSVPDRRIVDWGYAVANQWHSAKKSRGNR